jgi:para-nitrobenzyl esterase
MHAQASTRLGLVLGTALPSGVEEYLGIPFAKAPRRFEDPVDWDSLFEGGHRQARDGQSLCVQPGDDEKSVGSEDCLFLNIWRPPRTSSDDQLLPVLTFIHGGSFNVGGGLEYNCSHLARKHRAVYVTINYRLGVRLPAHCLPRPEH